MQVYGFDRSRSFPQNRISRISTNKNGDMSAVLSEAGRVSINYDSLTHIARVSFADVPYIEDSIFYSNDFSMPRYLISIEDSLIQQDREMLSAGFKRSFKENGKETRFTSYEIEFKNDDESYPLLTFHFTRSKIATPNNEMSTIVIHVDPYLYHSSAYDHNIVEVMKKFFLDGEYYSMMRDTVLKKGSVESLHIIPEKLRDFLIKGESNGQ